MTTEHVQIGIVGAGDRGRMHVRELYRVSEQRYLGRDEGDTLLGNPQPLYEKYAAIHPDWVEDVSDLTATVTAIFDPDGEARAAAANTCADHGDEPARFDSFDAFLAEGEFDAAVVASPNDTHVEAATQLLERGVDVLCEKPLATTLPEYDELASSASRSDGLFYTAFNMRSNPYYARLKELLDRQVVGDLGMISCREVRTPFPDGHYYAQAESGGSLLEKNCHDFDLMNWVTGADPIRVCAFGGQDVFTEGTDVNDHAVVVVEYDDGVRASLDLCLYAPYGVQYPQFGGGRDYAFRGPEGILKGRPGGDRQWELFTRNQRETYEVGGFAGSHGGSDYLQMLDFLRCVEGRREPHASIEDAKKAAAIAIGAERSIEEGSVVEIDSAYELS